MSKLFDDLVLGLTQAIEYERGIGHARITKFEITSPQEYSPAEIREIRMNANFTQSEFAKYMGVSKKTVEAWEQGYTHPSGSARRLFNILETQTVVPYTRVVQTV